jgi:serpin B
MTDDPDQTSESIRVLARRTPAASGWAAADVVRRTAVVRSRRRFVAGIAAVVIAAAGLALTTRGTSRHHIHVIAQEPSVHVPGAHPPGVHTGARIGSAVQLVSDASPLAKHDAADTSAVAGAEQRLAIRLLQTVNGPGNVSLSPASLYLALGMLQNGARGQTATQISDALQASGLSTGEQNAGLAGLTDELSAAAKQAGITLESANSIWQQRGFPIRKQFLANLATYYRTGVWQADFAGHNSDMLAAIDKWTSEHTHGKIRKLFDQLDPMTVLVLANAVYFHAAWSTPFDGHLTTDYSFTTGAGKQVPAKFMIGGSGLPSGTGPGYEAAQLPYRGGRFTALAVMPTSGSLADYVADLTPAKIDSITAALQPGAAIALPRFTTRSKTDLVPVLQGLGMHDAFTSAADLSGLSPACGCQVDQVLQRVYLGVGEKGTTAAAVTGISIIPTSTSGGLPALRFDHPFLFLIRDTQTGAILFASKIDDPTGS